MTIECARCKMRFDPSGLSSAPIPKPSPPPFAGLEAGEVPDRGRGDLNRTMVGTPTDAVEFTHKKHSGLGSRRSSSPCSSAASISFWPW
jgi:hypothetical protein